MRSGKKRIPLCNGAYISCVSSKNNIIGRESEQTSLVLYERELGKAADDGASCWCYLKQNGRMAHRYTIDWSAIDRNVRRLQVRSAQATKEGKWSKVRALLSLLTHRNRVSKKRRSAFEVLEPDDGKLSRPVVRGLDLSNEVLLLDPAPVGALIKFVPNGK